MALLDSGNNEFSTSVTRSGFHYKSRRLRKLLRALTAYQTGPTTQRLNYLKRRITRWVEENTNEAVKRGTLVTRLEQEVDGRLGLLNVNTDSEVETVDPHDRVDQMDDWETQWNGYLKGKFPLLQQIEITDLPSGVPGSYTFTKENVHSEGDRNAALAKLGPIKNPQYAPDYWLILGKLVLTSKLGKYYGRCFSCAAAVIASIVNEPELDHLVVEHVGSIAYDHHLIIVGRENANGLDDSGLNGQMHHWGNAFIIDVWQGNHSGNYQYVALPRQCDYVNGQQLRFFAGYPTNRRGADRSFYQGLRDLRTSPLNQNVMAQVMEQRGDTGVGPETEFVMNPTPPPTWIPRA